MKRIHAVVLGLLATIVATAAPPPAQASPTHTRYAQFNSLAGPAPAAEVLAPATISVNIVQKISIDITMTLTKQPAEFDSAMKQPATASPIKDDALDPGRSFMLDLKSPLTKAELNVTNDLPTPSAAAGIAIAKPMEAGGNAPDIQSATAPNSKPIVDPSTSTAHDSA